MNASQYSKLLDPVTDIRTTCEALLSGAFGGLGGDQREGLKTIHSNSGGLYALFMDVITSIDIDNLARRPYLHSKFMSLINPIIEHSRSLLDGVDGPLDDEQSVAVEFILHVAELMQGYVTSIWDYSQIRNGLVELVRHPVDLAALVQRLQIPESETVFSMEIDLPPNLPRLQADEGRLRQCLQQLMTNAIQYSGGDQLRIYGYLRGDHICLEVSDNGRGIAPRDLDRIFEPYYQADSSQEGLGLGLAITRALIELHNGWISAEPGAGARFTLNLPLK